MRPFRLALLAFFCLAPVAAFADPSPIISPFATARPVIATHGMVVTQEAAASRVGLDVLKRGGNAVDAAVAVGFALAVTLPRAGNIGGGGFMLIHRADRNQTIAIDYRETAPAATTKDVFLDANGEADPFKSRFSGLAIGVPGTVAGLELAWRKYGSGKFSFADLIAPAIALARQGLTVDDDVADSLPLAAPGARQPSFVGAHLSKARRKREAGRRSHRARRSRRDARDHRRGRRGRLLQRAGGAEDRRCGAGGGRADDDGGPRRAIARSSASRSAGPIAATPSSRCRRPRPAARISSKSSTSSKASPWPSRASIPPPRCTRWRRRRSSPTPTAPPGSAIPTSSRSRSPGLTSKAYAEHLRALISPDRARPATDIRPGEPQRYESDQTTHFSIVDSDGDAVANTYTLNLPYGSGLVADGTGVLLNNELDDFAAKPGAANVYGLLGGDANAPGPMKRPLSSMSPTLVFKDGKLDDGDRQSRRIAHHHRRAADHRQRDRPWAQCRRGRKCAARP